MRIGIDARVIEREKMTGMGRVLIEILKNIPGKDSANHYYLFAYERVPLDDTFYHLVPTASAWKSTKLLSPLWLLGILPIYLKRWKIDLFFTPNHFVPFRMPGTKWKSIFILHDTIHKLETRYHPFWYNSYVKIMVPRALKQCSMVATVSQSSKNDICRFYKTDPEKITVIYPIADKRFMPRSTESSECSKIRSITSVEGRFILYVGMIEERKNIALIIRLADMLKANGVKVPIILIGQPDKGGKGFIREIRKRDNMVYIPYLDDELLPFIYNMASIFLFPSFYEGFGVPPLEAMQSGTPVVGSNTSSLPEVIGDGGIQLDPDDILGYFKAITRLLEDGEFHAHMSAKGIEQAKKFNAENSAKQYIQLFNQFACER